VRMMRNRRRKTKQENRRALSRLAGKYKQHTGASLPFGQSLLLSWQAPDACTMKTRNNAELTLTLALGFCHHCQ
jgi:hypothetical protein